MITEIKYDYIFQYIGEFARVELKHKFGYIDKSGVEVVACEYDVYGSELMLEKYKLNQILILKLKSLI